MRAESLCNIPLFAAPWALRPPLSIDTLSANVMKAVSGSIGAYHKNILQSIVL